MYSLVYWGKKEETELRNSKKHIFHSSESYSAYINIPVLYYSVYTTYTYTRRIFLYKFYSHNLYCKSKIYILISYNNINK